MSVRVLPEIVRFGWHTNGSRQSSQTVQNRQWLGPEIDPQKPNGQCDWSALPDGSYFIEWREEGKRMRLPAGRTVSQALEAQHIKLAELAATEVGILQRYKPPSHTPEPEPMRLSASIRRYLDQIDTLKKPNTYRKYNA